MNNKISSLQVGMILTLLCCSLYLGISNIILIKKAENDVLISMILGIIIGIIPVLMYLKINDTYPKLNIYEKNIKLFGKVIGNIINVFIIIMYFVMLTISIRSIIVFLTSKYLENTPFYLVGILVILASLVVSFKGIETICRISQISFIICLILVVIIEIFLLKYVEINNVLPILINNNYVNNIFSGAIYYASSCGLLCMLLLSINKSKIKNTKRYNKTIILFYLIASISLTIVMFFVISCFGFKLTSLFRYPEYIILKKITLSNSDLHLENLLAFRWILYIYTLSIISIYGLIKGLQQYTKNNKKNNVLIIMIIIVSLVLSNTIFGNITNSIIIIKNYYVPFIALPMFIILTILFIKSFFKQKES